MAFSATITKRDVTGSMRTHYGTYTQVSGDTGGAITTGLKNVIGFQATGATSAVNSSGAVTIVTANPGADQTGYWQATGY
jgi:hypothetical protein